MLSFDGLLRRLIVMSLRPSAVLWPAPYRCPRDTPSPSSSSSSSGPQPAALLSRSIRVVNIGHTPAPAVSALPSQRASRPASLRVSPDASSPPTPELPGSHYLIPSQRRLLHCLLISTPTRISDRTQLKSEAKVFLFYFSALVYKVSLPVCTCQCLCVSSDARGCCCWDFAAQHAAYHHLQFK